jgi:hypothetical protein
LDTVAVARDAETQIAYVNAKLREMVDLLRITEAVDDEVRKPI